MEKTPYKKLVASMVMTVLFCGLFPAILNIVVDPYHIYHKGITGNHQFNRDKIPLMAGGLIDNYIADPAEGFDAVIIGTSTAVNYTPAQMHENFGWVKTANLSLSGSNYNHHQMLLERILELGHVRHVFLEISYHLREENTGNEFFLSNEDITPLYLYDRNWKNDYLYLFDMYVFFESAGIITGISDSYRMKPELPSSWTNLASAKAVMDERKSKAVLDEVIENVSGSRPVRDLSDNEKLQLKFPAIDYRLLPSIMQSCNSGVEFLLVFSPRPLYLWRTELYEQHEMYMRGYLAKKVAHCGNMRVFAMEQFQDIAGEPKNFIDSAHYIPEVNEKILRKIASGEALITTATVDAYEQKVIENMNALPGFLRSLYPDRMTQD